MRTITQTLNMTPGGVPPVIHVSQYDSDFTITFTLFSLFGGFTIESGTTAQIRGTKSSGTGYSADAAINISAKTVTVTGNAQMTAAAGQNIFEIVLKKNNKEISSKNFILLVERAALDADTITDESVLKELNAIIESADTATQAAEEAEAAADRAEAAAQSLEIDPTPTQGSANAVQSAGVYSALDTLQAQIPQIDPTLSKSGQAADAKKVGDGLAENKSKIAEVRNEIIRTAGTIEEMECGLTEEVKTALLACFEQVAWIGADGQTYYDALETALNKKRAISSISAVFTQGSAVVYDTDELYSLKQYLTVTVAYDDTTTKEVSNYTLDGTLTAGTSTITVAYGKKTTTFNVAVTHQTKTLESITATLSSSASITTDNVLDDLRPYLTVRASYSDGSTNTITNYTLSGSLNVGTNTITVTYSGKTATFTVNVTQAEKTLQSISAVFNQRSAVIYTDNSLNDLKPYLTVTARYSDSTTQTVTNYTLSGTLTKGTSTITVSYGGKTTTFNVTVSERSATLQSITAKFTQGSTVIYTDSSLDDLRPYLTVTARYSDSTTQTITEYTLSGTLTAGTSTITATYKGKTATFNVTVTHRSATLQSISATFNQGSAVIYDDATLDSLKQYLTVTAHYSDSSSATVTGYTLSGSLSVGTSTITATYKGKTDTFTVVVTAAGPTIIYRLPQEMEFDQKTYYDTGVKLHENDIDYTITIDFSTEDNSTRRGTILHCMHEESPYNGFIIDMYPGSSYTTTGGVFRIAYSDKQNETPKKQVPYSEKIVITHAAGSNTYKYYRYNSNELRTTGALDYNFVSISESIWLGAYRTTTGEAGRYFIGTISDFVIYNYAWTEEEANAYLQEEHN